ncbi:MAG: hypothetical protein IPI28_18120 [Candidatus Omnitrophica bacterium]|nr:hypothetical protein [Candidatus Omnitrophota bacterium]
MPSKRKPVVPTPEIISIADLSEVAALLAAGVEMVGQSFNGSSVSLNRRLLWCCDSNPSGTPQPAALASLPGCYRCDEAGQGYGIRNTAQLG